jgi:hypothetical protein
LNRCCLVITNLMTRIVAPGAVRKPFPCR